MFGWSPRIADMNMTVSADVIPDAFNAIPKRLDLLGRSHYYYYYYYSHIFPDSRAQHCNYATLLAGRSH